MRIPLRIIATLLLTCAGSAQISVSLGALAPVTVTASEPGTTNSNSLPVGPLPGYVDLGTSVPTASASYGHSYFTPFNRVDCAFGLNAFVAQQSSSAVVGPIDVLLVFQATTATPVRLSVAFDNLLTTPGTAVPTATVDVGNDGIVDFINGVQSSFLPPLVVGPQPLNLRVQLHSAVLQPGHAWATLGITLEPSNQVGVSPAAIGCAGWLAGFGVTPTFIDQGIRVGAVNLSPTPPQLPIFVVFGFNVQPLLLPTFGTAPCLFVPTPDVIVPLAGTIDIGLPAAVRPVTFWVQGVLPVLPTLQLLTTDCLRIDAQ